MKQFPVLSAAALLILLMAPAADAAANNCLACHGNKTIMDQGIHL